MVIYGQCGPYVVSRGHISSLYVTHVTYRSRGVISLVDNIANRMPFLVTKNETNVSSSSRASEEKNKHRA